MLRPTSSRGLKMADDDDDDDVPRTNRFGLQDPTRTC